MATVTLFNRISGFTEDAELFDDVSLDDFKDSQTIWRPVLWAASANLRLSGKPIPLYQHWDWQSKSRFLGRMDVSFFGVRIDGLLQGLMKADSGSTLRCRLDEQSCKELVYLDYVEVAPWNIAMYMGALGRTAMYSRVGVRLVQAAVKLSFDNEFKGRIGLHSLPDAEDFYRKIGMTPTTRDKEKENLLWFEFTSLDAKRFLETYL